LNARAIDPRNKEADGLLHAELYVSRPPEHADAMPLNEMISVTSGENRSYGRRYRRIAPRNVKLMC
jgi:hypothetical protein